MRYTIKYYKGLGTSTDEEAHEYFSNLRQHILDFQYVDSNDDEQIDLAFNKKKADLRKVWINNYNEENFIDHSLSRIKIDDFINMELVEFSRANCVRAIPNVIDGFKPGQRKIIFACFKKNLKKEIKVAQLSGYVGEHSAYHHGEASLAGTIINLA
jgi:DNA topoisomerase-2